MTTSIRRAKRQSSRRVFLRTVGASLVLPTLPSLMRGGLAGRAFAVESGPRTTNSGATDSVRRFCCIYFPNGVSLPPASHPLHQEWHWFPHELGADYRFTRPLESLAGLREEMTILSGLSHPATRGMVGHVVADSFLTAADQSHGYTNGISIDQVYAAAVEDRTRFPSLSLSSDGGVGTPGRTKTLSFTSTGKPIPSLSEPRQIFNRLFGVDVRSVEQQRLAFGRDHSILDHLLEQTNAIHRQLAPADQRRLDEYTNSIREIERRLARAERWLDVQKPLVDPEQFDLDLTPARGGEDYIRVILDLMHTALVTDSTRAITYQITSEDAKGIGDRFPRSIGLGKNHHDLSHGTGTKDGYLNWAKYDQFLASQFAYFLERLRSTDDAEAEGSLLDNTIVLYGCGTSRTHQAVNYPLILAGGANAGLKHGQHRRFDESKVRMSDLYVTLLQQLGVEAERFADSTGTIDALLT